MENISLPKGTRDFAPDQMTKRLYIIDHIKKIFCRYGFQPLETPAMEHLSTLTGKYGDEGDQLLYRILNSGDFLHDIDMTWTAQRESKKAAQHLSEKGLRYDLTVPFARFVVMNRHALTFPFKRYQIQPVWRADRPQKGRYREFYQCDADVVGTESLTCEAEIILMIQDAFAALKIADYTILINHRQLLSALAEKLGMMHNESALFVAIDKLDKQGKVKVQEELLSAGMNEAQVFQLFDVLEYSGTDKLNYVCKSLGIAPDQKGIAELNSVLSLLKNYGRTDAHVKIDLSLARGLSYYTGCIFEVKPTTVAMGSIGGGGRYDNLTALFDSKEKKSGVGFSFGIDRIYDVMEELQLFPPTLLSGATALVVHLDETCFDYALGVAGQLRESGISTEAYPDTVKLKKQMEYADKKKIPFVIVIGSDEANTGLLSVKEMSTGQQIKLTLPDVVEHIKKTLT